MNRFPLMSVACDACNGRWKVPASTADGDLHVFHDSTLQRHVVLNVYDDPFFEEVVNLVDRVFGRGDIKNSILWDIDMLLSELGDPDESGRKFNILANIRCPVCRSNNLTYGLGEPPEGVVGEFPLLKHEHWSDLGESERIVELKRALEKMRDQAEYRVRRAWKV